MTELGTRDPFEVRLRDALRVEADRSPTLPDDWTGLTGAVVFVNRSARWPTRRLVVAAVGFAATVLLIVALAIVRHDRDQSAPSSAPPAWRPDGIESPIVDLGPATEVWDGPVVAALTRKIGVDGHPPQILTTSLTYSGGTTAFVQSCTWENGSGGCRPDWNPATWSISQTSSVDNGVAAFDLWTLEGLPADAAYVTYAQGASVLWQRPIAGYVAFPYEFDSSTPVVTAYNEFGTEVGRYDETQRERTQPPLEIPTQVDLPQDQFEAMYDLTRESLRTCLTEHGGTIGSGDVATFPDGGDITAWNDCVSIVKQTVAARVTELTG
jgi:hypothetical protein